MVKTATVRTALPEERERVFDSLVLAFAADPLIRWMWPDPAAFVEGWRRTLTPHGGAAFDAGTAFVTAKCEAAALWFAPGNEADMDAMIAILAETVPAERMGEIAEFFELAIDAYPEGEFWYLPVIGCDPAHIGQGYGNGFDLRHLLGNLERISFDML